MGPLSRREALESAMSESVPVRCPACRREHVYTAPSYPCVCGAAVAPPLDRGAAATAVTHRVWDQDWVTVHCPSCGRRDEWPQPELGCDCGTVLRIPVTDGRPGEDTDTWVDTGPGAGARAGEGSGPGAGLEAFLGGGADSGTAAGADADLDTGAEEAGADAGTGTGSAPGPSGGAKAGPVTGAGTDARAQRAQGRSGTGRRATHDSSGHDRHAGPGRSGAEPHTGPGRPAADPLASLGRTGTGSPPTPDRRSQGSPPAPRSPQRRRAFQPITIRTARDAVTVAALYLRWLGYRNIRRADQRPPSGVGLAARGIVAQVDPTVSPASLRDVECLWLTAMVESTDCVYFSLAGYTDDARARADSLGIPLFVLDLTGTPQPANSLADDLNATGA